ncbi:Heavy metal-associated domain, HMA [Sesbania bispinosa]|nr:Heavy metal-associated domain, HMA [Sesbania bispinosa]
MKGMNLFCSSAASTVVTDHRSMVRRSTKRLGSVRRKNLPCSSQFPINPKPYHDKHRKSSSTRYLLSDTPFIDWMSESDKISAIAPVQNAHKPTQDQVVVLRVSLHCKACEGKVRKHISKMEGVTSFSIDMEAKKVTIMGHVTPLGVLASVSKVKNAQLWPSPTSSLPLSVPASRGST